MEGEFTQPPGSAAAVAANTAAIAANTASITTLTARLDNRDQKDSVRAASLTNLTLSGAQTVDGVTLVSGVDRVAALGQTAAATSGIYLYNSAGAWTRTTDADTSAKVTSGMWFFVEEGTVSAGKAYELTTANPIVLGTTALTFAHFAGTLKTSEITNDSSVVGTTSKDALNTLVTAITANTANIALKANVIPTIRAVTGTTDTVTSADSSNIVHCTNAGAVAIGVPSGLPVGAYMYFFGGGAATQGTFTGSGGLTVTPPPGFTAKSRVGASGASVTLVVMSSTLAYLTGDCSF